MANVTEIRNAIQMADSVEDYIAADAMLRGATKEPEYLELLGTLNARSAPQMFALKSEIEQSGLLGRFMQDAATLRAAGYPQDREVQPWVRRVLTEGYFDAEQMVGEVMLDEALTDEQKRSVVRLINARREARGGVQTEANWTDVALSPAGQTARVRLEMRVDEIAAYEGGDMYQFLLERIQTADRAAALEILSGEVYNVDGEEARLLRAAIQLRTAVLAGEAFARIVEEHGWSAVQAIYQRGDVTRSLTDADLVAEFMDLMGQIKNPLAEISRVDEKLGKRVVGETWARSGERLRDRQQMDEARRRIEERLADL